MLFSCATALVSLLEHLAYFCTDCLLCFETDKYIYLPEPVNKILRKLLL